MFGQQQNTDKGDPSDVELPDPPSDGISSLAWSPKANFLCAGSWDSKVRIYEVQSQPQLKGAISQDGPVLCCAWNHDGTRVFSGGCDNKAKIWDLASNQNSVIAQHDAPIKEIAWVQELNMLVTGSWDKTLKYWDCRTPNATHTQQLPERVYCMDVRHPLCVVGTAERHVVVFDLRKPNQEFKRFTSPLHHQSRTVACFNDKNGFALGSIEGRVAIHHIDNNDNGKNFAFKCHRHKNAQKKVDEIYSINALAFHPVYGTFATCGSDGTYNFWDKDNRARLRHFQRCSTPVAAASFNAQGNIFAYALSYDWSQGSEGYNPNTMKNRILLHQTPDEQVKPKPART